MLIYLYLKEQRKIEVNTVAFSVDKTSFLQFKEHLTSCNVPISVIDHEVSLSVYFTDPYDNKYEITTYDYFEL